MTFTHALSTNNYGCSKFIVDGTTVANGTHTTIQAAITAASSGDTVFVRDGSYTEDLTLKAGVNLTSWGSSSSLLNTPLVKIIGKATFTGSGTVTIYGVELQTNSDYFLVVSGNSASNVTLRTCFLNCLNFTGINYTSSSASSAIQIWDCTGDLGTTGIGIFTGNGAGGINSWYSYCGNSGGSTANTTLSAGGMGIYWCNFPINLSFTGTAAFAMLNSQIGILTANGSGNGTVANSRISGSTSSAVSVGAGAQLTLSESEVSSSNTNAITGAGTIRLGVLTFSGSSSTVNTTTIVPLPLTVLQGGTGVGAIGAYALVCGGTTTTGALQSVADVATGQVLVSGGVSALPAFSASPSLTSITLGGGTALSSYVEGTFTPTVDGAVSGSTTYTSQVGGYVRIGNFVWVTARIVITAATGTGNAQLGALPFTTRNTANQNSMGSVNLNGATWAWPAGRTSIATQAGPNATLATINTCGTSVAQSTMQMTNGAATFVYSFSYEI